MKQNWITFVRNNSHQYDFLEQSMNIQILKVRMKISSSVDEN